TTSAVQVQPPNASTGNGFVGAVINGGQGGSGAMSGTGLVVNPGSIGAAASTDYALIANAGTTAAIHARGQAIAEGLTCDSGTIAGTGVAARFNGHLGGYTIIVNALSSGDAAQFVANTGTALECSSSGTVDTVQIFNASMSSTGRALNCGNSSSGEC